MGPNFIVPWVCHSNVSTGTGSALEFEIFGNPDADNSNN